MKLASVLLPVIAVTAMALGGTFARAAESKVKIGVTLAMFDDVFITNVRDAMTKWASSHPDVGSPLSMRPVTPPSRWARWKTSWLREWMRW